MKENFEIYRLKINMLRVLKSPLTKKISGYICLKD